MKPVLPRPQLGAPAVRHRFLVIGIMLVILALAGRLLWVQGLNSQAPAEQAIKERTVTRVIPALRGDILDRSGAVLATSVQRYDLWVNQKQVGQYLATSKRAPEKGIPAAAKALAPVLGWSVQDTTTRLTGDRGFQYLVKGVTPQVRNAVMSQKIPGIGADPVAERTYPAADVGGNVIGYVDGSGTAQAGVEKGEDSLLSGTNGSTRYERGAGGQIIPTGEQKTTPATNGRDVALTIDRDLQWKAQQVIAATVKKFNASGGSVVALNRRTGEVLALVDYPTYDPNNLGRSDPSHLGNQSISNVFDPGSTGKLFTMTAAIDQGKVTPSSQYTVPYTMEFQGSRIKDSHPHPTQKLTLAGVLKNSSNVGTVQIAETLTPQVRYDYLRAFGLGQRTGIELPHESAGLLPKPEKWTGRTRYTTAFGQGYSVTSLQITSAVSAIANGGVRVEPTIIRGVVEKGKVQPVQARKQTRVMKPATAETMRTLMDNDITDDGKQNANVPHYAVAGKTGTAQVPGGTYTASFIGYTPADDPDLVIGVFVYGLKTFISGNTAAAPAWSTLMTYALQEQRIPPTGKPGAELPDEW